MTTDPAPTIAPARLAAGGLFLAAAAGLLMARAAGLSPFSWLETAAALTSAACVLLVVWRSVWNFPVGVVACALYAVHFYEFEFYADAGLQFVYIGLAAHGWLAWLRGAAGAAVPVRRAPLWELTALAAAFPAAWLGLIWLLKRCAGDTPIYNPASPDYDPTVPVYDAFLTALSLAAQWLLNRRYVENWLAWVVADQVYVVVFWSRGMHLTAVLYAALLAMCVAGLIEWRRDLAAQAPETSP